MLLKRWNVFTLTWIEEVSLRRDTVKRHEATSAETKAPHRVGPGWSEKNQTVRDNLTNLQNVEKLESNNSIIQVT